VLTMTAWASLGTVRGGNNTLLRIIVPTTGSPCVLGIPPRGGIFMPSTGGLPVLCMPLEP
jgi:hypothetical protein